METCLRTLTAWHLRRTRPPVEPHKRSQPSAKRFRSAAVEKGQLSRDRAARPQQGAVPAQVVDLPNQAPVDVVVNPPNFGDFCGHRITPPGSPHVFLTNTRSKCFTNIRLPRCTTVWPSERSLIRWRLSPPGYLGLSSPRALRVRQ